MTVEIAEKDWKYLRSIHGEMLDGLCRRINKKTAEILQCQDKSEHQKYQTVYDHIMKSDKIIAKCFDDWRRSNILLKLLALRHERLFTDDHARNLSERTLAIIDLYEGG